MKIEVVPVLGDNYAYVVACTETGQAAVVDPGEAEAVIARAESMGVELTAVWNTHHHFDHIGGNDVLVRERGLRLFGHKSDRGRIPGLTDKLEHGDRFKLGALQVRALHTPGHTMGAVCYQVGDALFTGDTLFGGGCGRLFEGDPDTMHRSLSQVICALDPATRLYFGHEYTAHNLDFALTVEPGNRRLDERMERALAAVTAGEPTVPGTLEEELATNPFLRGDSEEIRASLSERYPDDQWTPLQVFTRLRELRNSW